MASSLFASTNILDDKHGAEGGASIRGACEYRGVYLCKI